MSPDLGSPNEKSLVDRPTAIRDARPNLDVQPPLDRGRLVEHEVIGQGGMGIVWRARDVRLNRLVAVKRILPGLANYNAIVGRFLEEAKALAQLTHPNIVQIYALGKDEYGDFIEMEFVEGATLLDLIKLRSTFSVDEAIGLIGKVCNGLQMVHKQGIIHRDIKPSNILIDANGEPKLTDFGLAQSSTAGLQTLSGQILGTEGYMAPEQIEDAKNVTPTSDQYSLAATLYHMVTGSSPRKIDLRKVPVALLDIVTKALEDDPKQRFDGITEFHRVLGLAMRTEPVNSPQTSTTASMVSSIVPMEKAVASTDASKPRWLTVPSSEFPTIMAAMQSAQSGDTIYLRKGTYREFVEFKSGIELRGEDRDACIITFVSSRPSIISMKNVTNCSVLDVTICGLRFESASGVDRLAIGIGVIDSTAVVRNCRITKNQTSGISVEGPDSKVELVGSISEANGESGILIQKGAKAEISQCICRNNIFNGICVERGCTCVTLLDNRLEFNATGILFRDGVVATARKNHCKNNHQSGIAVLYASPVISDCISEKNGFHGIYIDGASVCTIEESKFHDNRFGISARKCAPTLYKNSCDNNWYGIFVVGCEGAAKGNRCYGNKLGGINICKEATMTLESNACGVSSWGLVGNIIDKLFCWMGSSKTLK